MATLMGPRIWTVLPLLFLGWTGRIVSAQAIKGVVLDDNTGDPVDGVSVLLLDAGANLAAGVLSNQEGRFFLQAPQTGRYRIRLERIGYQTTTSSEVDLLPPDTVPVELRLAVEAIVLAPLTITSERPPLVMDTRLASWGYYDRKALFEERGTGLAHFLELEDIRRKNPMRVTDVFRDLAGVRVVGTGGRRVRVRGLSGCSPTFYLDGVELRLAGQESVDDYVIPSHLSAVEVYARPPYPAQYAPRARGLSQCSSIVLWTGYVVGKE
jgi:hypothetical protein